MRTSTFANGNILTSTALTPDTIATIFQGVVAQVLGYQPTDPTSWSAVRIGWQQDGQPAWAITDDVCVITATPNNHPYSRVRDSILTQTSPTAFTQTMSINQVWDMAFHFYGPTANDNARLLDSALSFDWTHDILALSSIYVVPDWNRPVYVPELVSGQWWKRADLLLQYNELVLETYPIPAAAGLDVTVITDTGQTETTHIGN
jgi:hypothetical protein